MGWKAVENALSVATLRLCSNVRFLLFPICAPLLLVKITEEDASIRVRHPVPCASLQSVTRYPLHMRSYGLWLPRYPMKCNILQSQVLQREKCKLFNASLNTRSMPQRIHVCIMLPVDSNHRHPCSLAHRITLGPDNLVRLP